MTFDDIKEMQIGSKKVKEAWLNGRQVYPSEKRIMDSLVCWYDIGKQQCTNESMAANPVLADLSGNGHDATCYNFAWSGMSGIGGEYTNFAIDISRADAETLGTQKWLIKSLYNNVQAAREPIISFAANFTGKGKTFIINIDGIPLDAEADYLKVVNNVTDWNQNLSNGNNTVTFSEDSEGYFVFRFLHNDISNITIEILPEYPNALVSDGVDDYCLVEGLPILTDYTVIAKRKILADKVSALVSKATSNDSTDGAFIFDAKNGGGYIACNFGANNPLVELYPEDVSYQTKESYNGSPIIKLNNADTDKLSLFAFSALPNLVSQYALYSFILFDRTLTTAEIEWVKKNMIEGDFVLPSYELDPSLIDAWIFSGHTNDQAPSRIVGENGIALNCFNFAWNKEGSGFKDGALCFDGVDDCCVAWNELTCDRNVTVIGKRRLTSAKYNLYQNSLNIHIDSNLPYILFLDYYIDTFESANGHKLKCVFGDYEYYYDNDTEPHSFWATKDAFNGQAYNNKAFDFENGLKYDYNIYLGRVWSGAVAQCEWYYLAIYDKVMTEKEAQAEIEKLEKIWSNRKKIIDYELFSSN